MLEANKEILWTRQRHDAKRAGLHYDIRLVYGTKAYSWATRKEMPDPGKAIMLYEQPVHGAHYALQEFIHIPDGQYGAGTTTLDFVKKALVGAHSTPDQLTIHVRDGDRYLLKRMSHDYGTGHPWLLKNLGPEGNEMTNKYLKKIASYVPQSKV